VRIVIELIGDLEAQSLAVCRPAEEHHTDPLRSGLKLESRCWPALRRAHNKIAGSTLGTLVTMLSGITSKIL
jgi:hypothetical protein